MMCVRCVFWDWYVRSLSRCAWASWSIVVPGAGSFEDEDVEVGVGVDVDVEAVGGPERGVAATSARLCPALCTCVFSTPRSCRSDSIIPCISDELRRGCPQKVQGPRPSFTQIIFPQFRQLGAVARRGCRVDMQLQAREGEEGRVGLVCCSSERIAESYV